MAHWRCDGTLQTCATAKVSTAATVTRRQRRNCARYVLACARHQLNEVPTFMGRLPNNWSGRLSLSDPNHASNTFIDGPSPKQRTTQSGRNSITQCPKHRVEAHSQA